MPKNKVHSTEHVPWARVGRPGSPPAAVERPWQDTVANVGGDKWHGRLPSDNRLLDKASSDMGFDINLGEVMERAFAQWWDYENNHDPHSSLLYQIVDMHLRRSLQYMDHKHRQLVEQVVASVIQWLGTAVGGEFVTRCHKLAHAERARLRRRVAEHRKLLQAVGELPYPSDSEIWFAEQKERLESFEHGAGI